MFLLGTRKSEGHTGTVEGFLAPHWPCALHGNVEFMYIKHIWRVALCLCCGRDSRLRQGRLSLICYVALLCLYFTGVCFLQVPQPPPRANRILVPETATAKEQLLHTYQSMASWRSCNSMQRRAGPEVSATPKQHKKSSFDGLHRPALGSTQYKALATAAFFLLALPAAAAFPNRQNWARGSCTSQTQTHMISYPGIQRAYNSAR